MFKTFELSAVTRIELTGVIVNDPATHGATKIKVTTPNPDVDVYLEDGVLHIVGGVQTEQAATAQPTKYNINLPKATGLRIGEDFPAGATEGKFRLTAGNLPLVSVEYPPEFDFPQATPEETDS